MSWVKGLESQQLGGTEADRTGHLPGNGTNLCSIPGSVKAETTSIGFNCCFLDVEEARSVVAVVQRD